MNDRTIQAPHKDRMIVYLGVAIVLRSTDKNKIEFCKSEIIKFVKDKEIQIV